MNIEQAKDLGVYCIARSARFVLGWYWKPSEKATIVKAEHTALEAYRKHKR